MTTKIRAFVLSFSDGQEVFYSGQTVSGKCLLSIDAPLKARGVRLAIKGEAHVFWTKLKSRRKESSVGVDRGENYTEQYSSREVYFNLRTTLWGKGTGGTGWGPFLPFFLPFLSFFLSFPRAHASLIFLFWQAKRIVKETIPFFLPENTSCHLPFNFLHLDYPLHLKENTVTFAIGLKRQSIDRGQTITRRNAPLPFMTSLT